MDREHTVKMKRVERDKQKRKRKAVPDFTLTEYDSFTPFLY